MLSFFKKQKPTINSLVIPNFNWDEEQNTDSIILWTNPEQTMVLSLNYIDSPPNIPTISQVETLRNYYREMLKPLNSALVEVDILNIKNIDACKLIMKVPQKPSGMTYLASLTFPFKKCHFVVKIQCAEVGTTGVREAVVLDRLISNKELIIGENGFEDFYSDPYDKTIKGGLLRNKSEDIIYDDKFPNHPLTQARRIINKIIEEIEFKPEINKLEPFGK